MAGPSSPRRRQRAVEDDGYQGGEPYSSSPKRARLEEDPQESDDHVNGEVSEDDDGHAPSESPDGPILPDSYRRSPKAKGKGRATATGKHLPGSIVRVTLTNFVTYTKAEFLPGPSLNMIIGPNGTGKSTLVCAICLGLGSKPDVLGRAKNVGEFVKHGHDKAQIEIELAADPARHNSNPVVTTKIARDPKGKGDKGSSEKKDGRVYLIDGRKATAAAVTTLMRSFSIQVDNLCQFLPQDRVVEFAALSPINLLAETQRAAAPPEMSQWHDQLKHMRKQQKAKQTEQQQMVEDLKRNENRQESQRDLVERLRERTQLQERRTLLERLRPLPEYARVCKELLEAKERKRTARDELAELQRRIEPNMVAETEKRAYLERVKRLAATRDKLVDRTEKQASDAAKAVKDKANEVKKVEGDVTAAKKAGQKSKSELPALQASKAQLERALGNAPPEVDLAAYNEQIREKARLVRDVKDRLSDIKTEIGSACQHISQQESIIQRAESEKETLQTQAGQQASKLKQVSQHAYRAWKWLKENENRFEGKVYGPAIVECMVKDSQHASAVESLIGQSALSAFTTTSQKDYGILQDALSNMRLNVHIRNNDKPLGFYRPKIAPDALRAYGLECYVLDLITGPDAVLGMLCDNHGIHKAAYASRQLSNAQLDTLKLPDSQITQWVTPTESFTVLRRSEYGSNAVSIRTNAIRAAKFFTDAPPNQDEDAELDVRITEARRVIDEYKQQRRALAEEQKDLSQRLQTLVDEEQALKEEKSVKQRRISEFNALPTKIEGVQKKIDEAQALVNDSKAELTRLLEQIDKLTIQKGQLAIDYANLVNSLRDVIVQSLEAKISEAEALSDLQQLEARTAEEKDMMKQKEHAVDQIKKDIQNLLREGKVLERQCAEATEGLNDEQMEVAQDFQRRPAVDLETEIESVIARLQMSDGANQRVLGEFEDRARRVEQQRERLATIEASLEQLETEIANIREQWEPRLDALVSSISHAFADNFSKIQCAGEVVVHKDENFEQWALHLKVKFRENEQLSILDNHRQSGGERAVSTIFYLMSLQSLARAPFRVVDEINQGMDPRNERLVHSRMVDIACAEDSASQYFLITPKLLRGLKYHPSMKVHCIASGEHMPEDHKELDFGMLAQRALRVRAAAAA